MKQHDQGADADVVGTVGETEQEDGGQMVDHLLFKILVKYTYICSISVKQNGLCMSTDVHSHLLTMCCVTFLFKAQVQAVKCEI